jgi:hypothetical protein
MANRPRSLLFWMLGSNATLYSVWLWTAKDRQAENGLTVAGYSLRVAKLGFVEKSSQILITSLFNRITDLAGLFQWVRLISPKKRIDAVPQALNSRPNGE